MPFISMRDLLRDPKSVFSRLEEGAEPFIVTRHGQPVAALTPIVESELEALVLAASPDLLESRQEAENAVAEGRVEPFVDFVKRFDDDEGAAGAEDSASLELNPQLAKVFGAPLAEEITAEVGARVEALSRGVLEAISRSGTDDPSEVESEDATSRIREVNAELFDHMLVDVIDQAASGVFFTLGTARKQGSYEMEADEPVFDQKLGRKLATTALDQVSGRLQLLNDKVLEAGVERGNLSLSTYETTIHGIDAFEKVSPRRSSVPPAPISYEAY